MPSLKPLAGTKMAPATAPPAPVAVAKTVAAKPTANLNTSANNRSMVTATVGADEAFEFSDEEDVESSVEEKKQAASKAASKIDFSTFNYKTADLNKLGDEELKAHKAAMEVNFQKNNIRKGDPGFQYDKRVDFKYNAAEAQDDSWDESEDQSDDGGVIA